MKILILLVVVALFLSITDGQQCQGKFNETIKGQCSYVDDCRGAVLTFSSCEWRRCCVNGTVQPSPSSCLADYEFDILYNTSRAAYLRTVLNYGINLAGICENCQAKAAFLAIAATMTGNFQRDEAIGTDAQFAGDDNKYGNNQTDDGSRFRRRGLFGLRGREMYARLQRLRPQYQSLSNPETVALINNAINIAALLWNNPNLQSGSNLTTHADGTFYGFSMLWYKLTGGIEDLAEGAQQYSKFLRQLQCGGDLYPGQGPTCQYNSTHNGSCSPDCIRGLEEVGEYCGCSTGNGGQCTDSPVHVRCCLDTCSQELKMDLGLVLDASGSIDPADYRLQLQFTKDLLRRVNVGKNKTHVGIINYSNVYETLTWLNTDYSLEEKLRKVDTAQHYQSGTNTALALQQTARVFSSINGLRQPQEGATPVIFVITDGKSDNPVNTIQAAAVLKNQSINLISVGVGDGPDETELNAICTPPASVNSFLITNYAALDVKLNQFTSKTCTEPAVVPSNTTVTGEIGKDKYKFLKIEIVAVGNKILITVTLFNGKVKLFYSFKSRNPKDPEDFVNYELKTNARVSTATNAKVTNDEVTLVIDKPDTDVEFVYIGVKGVEEDNKFEVKLDDCANVDCSSKSSATIIKLSLMTLGLCAAHFFF